MIVEQQDLRRVITCQWNSQWQVTRVSGGELYWKNNKDVWVCSVRFNNKHQINNLFNQNYKRSSNSKHLAKVILLGKVWKV